MPTWMFRYNNLLSERKHHMYNIHHGKVVFGVSCVVLRGDSATMSKLMPASNRLPNPCICVKGYRHAVLGGVLGASGVVIPRPGSTVAALNASRYR